MSNTSLGFITPKPADLILPSTATEGALYLGSVKALKPEFLHRHRISVIISMTPVQRIPGMHHYRYEVQDHRSANRLMQSLLPGITDIINMHRKAGQNILVHCYAGIHRAPTVVSHYLQRYRGQSVNRSVLVIRTARPIAFYDGNTFDLQAYQENEWLI